MSTRPHIIIFNPDQMQCDALAHMGRNPAAQTPFLDHFAAEEAASYRNAYCQNPVCVPSRCSFLTGLYPHVHGHRTMRYMLHSEESSIFSELKAAGYHVWMNARNDFLPGQDEAAFHHLVTEQLVTQQHVLFAREQRHGCCGQLAPHTLPVGIGEHLDKLVHAGFCRGNDFRFGYLYRFDCFHRAI